jgi:hypothetical protein
MTTVPSIIIAAEDELSAAIMEKLLTFSGRNFTINRVIITHGYGMLKKKLPTFRAASKTLPHIILTDLDRCLCPSVLLNEWGATKLPQNLLFRIAIREVEAWLLADRKGISDFLHIDIHKIPHTPETTDDPKQTLVNLARKSRKPRLLRGIVPDKGSSAPIGPLYNSYFVNFVNTKWDIMQARQDAPSLDRTLLRIATFLSG